MEEKKTRNSAKKWMKEEICLLRTLAPTKTDAEIAALLGCPKYVVQYKRYSLGLHPARVGMGDIWTSEELDILRTSFPVSTKDEMCRLLPRRTWLAIWQHARRLGLHRDKDTLSRARQEGALKTQALYQRHPEIEEGRRAKISAALKGKPPRISPEAHARGAETRRRRLPRYKLENRLRLENGITDGVRYHYCTPEEKKLYNELIKKTI